MSNTRLFKIIFEEQTEKDIERFRDEVRKTVDPKYIVEDLQGNELGRVVLFEDAIDLYLQRYPYVKNRETAHPFITKIKE